MDIMKTLPVTCAQDFGRLAKIVAPYDTNSTYAYMKRVNDMKQPNPRGNTTFNDEKGFSFDVEEMTS